MRCQYPIGEAAADSGTAVICPECGLEQTRAQAESRVSGRRVPVQALVAGAATTLVALAAGAFAVDRGGPVMLLISPLAGAAVAGALSIDHQNQHRAVPRPLFNQFLHFAVVFAASWIVYVVLAAGASLAEMVLLFSGWFA